MGSPSLLLGIFLTHGSNPGLPLCRQIVYELRHQGSPGILEWVAYPFSSGSSQLRNWTGVSCTADIFFTSWVTREIDYILFYIILEIFDNSHPWFLKHWEYIFFVYHVLFSRMQMENMKSYEDQISSVIQSYLTLCNPMDCSMPGLPVHHQHLEFTQTHVHSIGDAIIQPSHPLFSPSPPAFNFPQHQGLFKWVSSSHQVTKVLDFQLQHQSFQWIFRTDLL